MGEVNHLRLKSTVRYLLSGRQHRDKLGNIVGHYAAKETHIISQELVETNN